eukprot:scaffold1594_cov269-Chaetoceros_neogracile.AAC.6
MAKIIREEVERLCRKAEEEATRLKASTARLEVERDALRIREEEKEHLRVGADASFNQRLHSDARERLQIEAYESKQTIYLI